MVRPPKFEITDERNGTQAAVAVAGELDLGTVEMLKDRIEKALDADLAELTVDLRKLDFIDSTGLRFLIELNARTKDAGWRLRLRAPENEAATLVFRITGMDSALPFDGSGPS
jgi:anti-sigma B factor antagonist